MPREVLRGTLFDGLLCRGPRRECGWKALGDLYTYGHKLSPMAFEGEGSRGKADALGLDTVEAAAAQLVRYRLFAVLPRG